MQRAIGRMVRWRHGVRHMPAAGTLPAAHRAPPVARCGFRSRHPGSAKSATPRRGHVPPAVQARSGHSEARDVACRRSPGASHQHGGL